MNTFLPFPDFVKSAACLDKRRCLKQVVEAHQILNVLDGKSNGWKNHPAVRMWVNHKECLKWYYDVFYAYCVSEHRIKFQKLQLYKIDFWGLISTPKWLGYEPFHQKMRENLLRKSLEDLSKGNNELSIRLAKQNILVTNTAWSKGYLWPVDKNE